MNTEQVMEFLQAHANDQARASFLKQDAPDSMLGVRIADLKKLVKKIGVNQGLALKLYETCQPDAQYLAGLIADPAEFSAQQLDDWATKASWFMVAEYSVAGVTAESPSGWDAAIKWIESDHDRTASAGWAALSNLISVKADDELDIDQISQLLQRAESSIDEAGNRTRYTMNGFVIAVGCYIEALTDQAMSVAEKLGKVDVDMGGTACKVPLATTYIDKVRAMGRLGKKRKHARC